MPADQLRAARMAYRVLLAQQIRTLPVDPLTLLRRCRDTRVMTVSEAAAALDRTEASLEALFADADADAATLRLPGESADAYVVVYRPDGHPARLRFTLAHELGHRLLGHAGANSAEEQEADCFASHLLCPDPVLHALRYSDVRSAAQTLATACYISLTCARVTLRRPPVRLEDDLVCAVADLLSDHISRMTSS